MRKITKEQCITLADKFRQCCRVHGMKVYIASENGVVPGSPDFMVTGIEVRTDFNDFCCQFIGAEFTDEEKQQVSDFVIAETDHANEMDSECSAFWIGHFFFHLLNGEAHDPRLDQPPAGSA